MTKWDLPAGPGAPSTFVVLIDLGMLESSETWILSISAIFVFHFWILLIDIWQKATAIVGKAMSYISSQEKNLCNNSCLMRSMIGILCISQLEYKRWVTCSVPDQLKGLITLVLLQNSSGSRVITTHLTFQPQKQAMTYLEIVMGDSSKQWDTYCIAWGSLNCDLSMTGFSQWLLASC